MAEAVVRHLRQRASRRRGGFEPSSFSLSLTGRAMPALPVTAPNAVNALGPCAPRAPGAQWLPRADHRNGRRRGHGCHSGRGDGRAGRGGAAVTGAPQGDGLAAHRGRPTEGVGERGDYREVLLERRLRAGLRRTSAWMQSDAHTDVAVSQLHAAARHVSAQSLPGANRDVSTLLLHGVMQAGPDERDVKTPFFDWSREALEGSREEVLARNDYLVVDQLRVCDADGRRHLCGWWQVASAWTARLPPTRLSPGRRWRTGTAGPERDGCAADLSRGRPGWTCPNHRCAFVTWGIGGEAFAPGRTGQCHLPALGNLSAAHAPRRLRRRPRTGPCAGVRARACLLGSVGQGAPGMPSAEDRTRRTRPTRVDGRRRTLIAASGLLAAGCWMPRSRA